MAKEPKLAKTHKTNVKIAYAVIAIALVFVVLLLMFRGSSEEKLNNGADSSLNLAEKVEAQDLISNKISYEGKLIKIENVLVPDVNFAYINYPNGSKEKLFIEPKKSEYCLYFNLIGKLQPDEKKDWIFYVENFECVSKN